MRVWFEKANSQRRSREPGEEFWAHGEAAVGGAEWGLSQLFARQTPKKHWLEAGHQLTMSHSANQHLCKNTADDIGVQSVCMQSRTNTGPTVRADKLQL